jgi:hypothetical protein
MRFFVDATDQAGGSMTAVLHRTTNHSVSGIALKRPIMWEHFPSRRPDHGVSSGFNGGLEWIGFASTRHRAAIITAGRQCELADANKRSDLIGDAFDR